MSSQPLSLLFILLGQGPQLQTWGPLEPVERMLWVDDATLEVTVTADLMSTPG